MIALHSTWILPVAASIVAVALSAYEPAVAQLQSDMVVDLPPVSHLSQPTVPSITHQAVELQAASQQIAVETQTEQGRLWPGVSEFENRFGDRGFHYRLASF
ncbi:MAG: hypothetical protein AB4040_10015 [Synechococcus sp.]